MLPLSWWNKVI